MAKITFIDPDGRATDIEAAPGTAVMKAAVDHGLPGIEAECGGACACATCHVYVALEWLDAVGPAGAIEAEMLAFACDPSPSSRLSCQIAMTAALDGLVVHLPVSQH